MIEVECVISINKNGICFLGPIKTKLLQEIHNCGSLNAAAKKLKISYQHAWMMLNDMNTAAPHPLVVKKRGGINGGGAEISDYGMKILNDYFLIQKQIQNLVNQINVEINL